MEFVEKRFILALCLSFFVGSPLASAEPKSAKVVDAEEVQVVEGVSCVLREDSRRLEVHTFEAGCKLQYSKFGKTAQIAQAKRGVDICKEALQKVRTKLEGSGYACK